MEKKQQMIQQVALLIVMFIQISYQQTCTSPTQQCDCVNTNGKLQIICRDKLLTAIPSFTPTSITYDEITFGSSQSTGCPNCNKITAVTNNAFQNLSVKKIVLTQNAISTFSANAFAGLETMLESLELEGDGTNLPPYEVIRALTNLQTLHLEHFDQPSMTTSNTLSPFPRLQKLTFKNINRLSTIDYDAFLENNQPKFPMLNTFNLLDVPTITDFPVSAIREILTLKELQVSGTGITRIYGSSFNTLNLINLHITHNSNLHTIDRGVFTGLYGTLEYLFLGHNNLRDLTPLGDGTWTKLTQLNLQYNPLRTIPSSSFSKMGQKLAYLNLDSCELTSIDSSIFNGLQALHTLILSRNEIQNVPASVFQNSPDLVELRLDKQKLPMTINTNSFNGIENTLNHLFIGNNTIDITVFWALIEKLSNLLELSASSLNLQTIPDRVFKNNDKITILDLEKNGITSLQEGSFYPLRDSLKSLTLSSNSISSISKCVLNNFRVLEHLYLENNPLDCDCSMRWLYDWVQAQTDKYQASFFIGVCTSPISLAGKLMVEIGSRTDMTCNPGYTEQTCNDLYATTTTTTTTQVTPPKYIVNIVFGQITHNSIHVMWTISDKTDITGYILEARGTNQPNRTLPSALESQTVDNLQPGTRYTFCLYLMVNNALDNQFTKCRETDTVPLTIPTISIGFGARTETSINIFWTVSDKTDVSGYVLEILKGIEPYREEIIHRDLTAKTIDTLEPNTYYTFCLYFKLNGVPYPLYQDCENHKTLEPQTSTRAVPTTQQPAADTGIIIGAVVGGVALIAIIILIVVILLRFKKPPKQPLPPAAPVSFMPAPSGSLPQAGGTARRFAKPKEGKDGAVGVDDIQINTISNGDLDGKDRFSAGSYQMLHEKDFHRPGSSASTGSSSQGHYVNDLSVERPLPRTPRGMPESKGAKSKGYVNTGFTGSADPLPASTNTYSEIDAAKLERSGKSEKATYI